MTKMRILDSTRGVGDVSEDPGAGEECRLKAAEESELTESSLLLQVESNKLGGHREPHLWHSHGKSVLRKATTIHTIPLLLSVDF